MAGMKISLTADEANAALARFRGNLQTTGASAIKTEAEIKMLEKQMLSLANQGKLQNSFNDLSKMLGLTSRDADKLRGQLNIPMGDNLEHSINKASNALLTFGPAALTAMYGMHKFYATLKEGINLIDEYQISAIKLAAMWVPNTVPGGRDIAQIYKDGKVYADQLLLTLERIDKETLLTANDLRKMTEEMSKQGIVMDTNNKEQVKGFTALANAVAVVSAGAPNKEIQIRQEIRALMMGEARAADQLGQILKAQVPDLKAQIELHKQQGDLIEWLGKQLIGFSAAQDDINATWEASKTTLETIYNKILRDGFSSAYKDIIEYTKQLSQWADDHKEILVLILKEGWESIKVTVDAVARIYENHKEGLSDIFNWVMKIVYGWQAVLVILPNIIEGFINIGKYISETAQSMYAFLHLDFTEGAEHGQKAWDLMWKKRKETADDAIEKIGEKIANLDKPDLGLGNKFTRPENLGTFEVAGAIAPKMKPKEEKEDKKTDSMENLMTKIQQDIDKMTKDQVQWIEDEAAKYIRQSAKTTFAGKVKELVDKWKGLKLDAYTSELAKKLYDQVNKIYEMSYKAETDISAMQEANISKRLAMEIDYNSKLREIKLETFEISERQALKEKQFDEMRKKERELLQTQSTLNRRQDLDLINPLEISKETRELQNKVNMLREESVQLEKTFAIEQKIYDLRLQKKIGFYDPEFEVKQKQSIATQAQEMLDAGYNEVGVRRWAADESRKVEEQKWQFILETTTSGTEAVNAQLKLMAIESQKSSKVWAEGFKQGIDSLRSSISDLLFDGMTNQMKSFQEYWKNFWSGLARAAADTFSKKFTGGLTELASGLLDSFGLGQTKNALGIGKANDQLTATNKNTEALENLTMVIAAGGSLSGSGGLGNISLPSFSLPEKFYSNNNFGTFAGAGENISSSPSLSGSNGFFGSIGKAIKDMFSSNQQVPAMSQTQQMNNMINSGMDEDLARQISQMSADESSAWGYDQQDSSWFAQMFSGSGGSGSSMVSGIGSGVGSILGSLLANWIISEFLHTGGVAGGKNDKALVSASVFDSAKRYHTGLKSDEIPAILQKGETVIPKGGSIQPSSPNISIVFEDHAGTTKDTDITTSAPVWDKRAEKFIVSVVMKSATRGGELNSIMGGKR